ncbi:MAG: hypothetical protein JWO36_2735 [Myxococcales bacterium]|nr:hypothetical protein [Myxococcales bacterium]
MKATKFIVLVAGMLGIFSFFLPLVAVQHRGTTATVSAYQVVKGLEVVSAEVDRGEVHSLGEIETRDTASGGLAAAKGIVIALFVPAALLALIGVLGVRRKQFGRVAGTFSLLLGLTTLAIGALLKSAAEGDSGIGITVLIVAGLAASAGGLLTLIKPDRRTAMQPQLASLPLAA